MSAVTMSPSLPPHAPGRPVAPSFATLTLVEFRKTVDTRAGQALLAGALLLSVAVVGYLAFRAPADALTYDNWLRDASSP